MESYSTDLYDRTRPRLLRLNDVASLAELCDVMASEVLPDAVRQNNGSKVSSGNNNNINNI